jgi:hypothetical protein
MSERGWEPEVEGSAHQPGRIHVAPAEQAIFGVPHTGLIEAVLLVDGLPLLLGNRSRLVYLAGELSRRRLPSSGTGRLEIVLLRRHFRGLYARATWHDPVPGVLHLAACFGGASLVGVAVNDVPASVSPSGPIALNEHDRVCWMVACGGEGEREVELVVVVERT